MVLEGVLVVSVFLITFFGLVFGGPMGVIVLSSSALLIVFFLTLTVLGLTVSSLVTSSIVVLDFLMSASEFLTTLSVLIIFVVTFSVFGFGVSSDALVTAKVDFLVAASAACFAIEALEIVVDVSAVLGLSTDFRGDFGLFVSSGFSFLTGVFELESLV